MSHELEIPAVGLLVLARLLPPGEKGEARSKVEKDLKALVQHLWEGVSWTDRFDRALDTLETAGLITRTRKGKAERFTSTPEGRRNVLEALGLDALPPKTTWAKIKSPYLLAYVLGLPAADAKRLVGAGLKTELLRARYGLPAGTAKQVAESLAWKLMGFEPGPRFNTTTIQEALFRRELGDADARKPLDLIAARSVGARQSKPAELSDAALRAWIDRSATAVESGRPAASPPSGEEGGVL